MYFLIFEDKYPYDNRPRKAIEECRKWANTGIKMSIIRKASLNAHAAAKIAKEDDAKHAAHATGQAVGTAHVVTHSLGASLYSIRAVAAHAGNVDDGLVTERNWQLELLHKYANHT